MTERRLGPGDLADRPGEVEDRHGDHWFPLGGEWHRCEAPTRALSRAALEASYGPLVDGHTGRCIRSRGQW